MGWSFSLLFNRAKWELKDNGSLGWSVLAYFIYNMIVGVAMVPFIVVYVVALFLMIEMLYYVETVVVILLLLLIPISIVLFFVVMAFVGGPFQVGMARFFTRIPYGDKEIGNIFYAFKKGRYLKIVQAMFLTNIKIFAWSLLFVVPGVIAGLKYYMVPYILSENPELPAQDAQNISCQMTDGEKGNIFLLSLIFVGISFGISLAGGILSIIPIIGVLINLAVSMGVGLVLPPIMETVYVQLYYVLRRKYFTMIGQEPPADPPSATGGWPAPPAPQGYVPGPGQPPVQSGWQPPVQGQPPMQGQSPVQNGWQPPAQGQPPMQGQPPVQNGWQPPAQGQPPMQGQPPVQNGWQPPAQGQPPAPQPAAEPLWRPQSMGSDPAGQTPPVQEPAPYQQPPVPPAQPEASPPPEPAQQPGSPEPAPGDYWAQQPPGPWQPPEQGGESGYWSQQTPGEAEPSGEEGQDGPGGSNGNNPQ